MRPLFFLLFLIYSSNFLFAQQHIKSIHQEELEYYNSLGLTKAEQYEELSGYKLIAREKSIEACPLNKIVFGWNPYWMPSQYNNFQWEQLSDLCYFSYEFSTATGNATNTHSWSSTPIVTAAQSNNTRVHLCVTLFSDHATFLTNSTAQQTLITNLIAALNQRNAIGINIDFEGVPNAQSANFTAFMKNLSQQVHNAISGSIISICLPSVEWNPTSPTYDVTSMSNDVTASKNVDWFIIMGYGYYYSGSSQAGPTDPLYNLTTGYNYCLTKSITYYLSKGVPNARLVLGLPSYGYDWATQDNSVPATTTATGTAKTYKQVRDNTNGYYSSKLWNNTSYIPYYTYQNGTQWHECWIIDAYAFGRRLDLVNQRDIGGIGIWALGNDDTYSDLWNKIKDKFSPCGTVACSDTIYDMGGPERNYYDKENYTYTITPTGASNVSLTFSSFSTEANFDTLWLYDGSSISSGLIGSYTGTNSPGTVNSTGNSITLRYKSDNTTNAAGWMAVWQCNIDNIAPATTITAPSGWITSDFTANFTDTDNGAIEKSYYQVLDFDGQNWGANSSHGFFADDFDAINSGIWNIPTNGGNWSSANGFMHQGDSSITNTNIYAALTQNLSNRYLYHFTAKIESAPFGTNQRRIGFHFFCDTGSTLNRSDSYFIFFRQETSKLEFYKVVNNTSTQVKIIDNVVTTIGQLYDLKVIYDRITGKISVYRDNLLLGTWTDLTPLTTPGNFISFRTGNCKASFGELKIFRSRNPSANISLGSVSADIRFQNPNPTTYAAKIKSIVNDQVGNLSTIAYQNLQVDWSAPSAVSVNDGVNADIDETLSTTDLSANWTSSADVNSGIAEYKFAIGSTYGGTDVMGWTSNSLNTFVNVNSLNLSIGNTYYFSVKSVNGAGLESGISISDGITVILQAEVPVAGFVYTSINICSGDSVAFTNTSLHALNYLWSFSGGSINSTNIESPVTYFDTTGIYQIQLIASGLGGIDTISQTLNVVVNNHAIAGFNINNTSGHIPFLALFTNTSQNANGYIWDFGDGTSSTGINPYHIYSDTGYFSISLIALNNNCGNDTLTFFNMIHVDDPTFVATIEKNNFNFTISPNPVTDNFTISYTSNEPAFIESRNEFGTSIEICNIFGQKIFPTLKPESKYGKNYYYLNAKNLNLSEGVYLIKLYANRKFIETKRVVLIK